MRTDHRIRLQRQESIQALQRAEQALSYAANVLRVHDPAGADVLDAVSRAAWVGREKLHRLDTGPMEPTLTELGLAVFLEGVHQDACRRARELKFRTEPTREQTLAIYTNVLTTTNQTKGRRVRP